MSPAFIQLFMLAFIVMLIVDLSNINVYLDVGDDGGDGGDGDGDD